MDKQGEKRKNIIRIVLILFIGIVLIVGWVSRGFNVHNWTDIVVTIAGIAAILLTIIVK